MSSKSSEITGRMDELNVSELFIGNLKWFRRKKFLNLFRDVQGIKARNLDKFKLKALMIAIKVFWQ